MLALSFGHFRKESSICQAGQGQDTCPQGLLCLCDEVLRKLADGCDRERAGSELENQADFCFIKHTSQQEVEKVRSGEEGCARGDSEKVMD